MAETTNYSLPQWEAHDPIRREDFNGAFAALDACYSADNDPWVWGNVQIPSDMATGTAIATFDFNPKLAIVMVGTPAVLFPGYVGQVLTSAATSSPSSHYLSFRLSLNRLVFTARGSSAVGTYTCCYLARR